MRYQSAVAFRQALEDRLKSRAKSSGLDHARLWKLVAFERLLARLVVVAPNRWILKGGLALDFRFRGRARSTRDLDLGRDDDEEAAGADFRAARLLDLSDHFGFLIERTSRLDHADVEGAVRYQVRCSLAGRVFTEFPTDVGFHTRLVAEPEQINGPDLLAFAELPLIQVPVISLAQHVAEKIHAYTRRYGPSTRPSTRVKDLIDLVLIQGEAELKAQELRSALDHVFSVRHTHELPDEFPLPPADWRIPYRRDVTGLAIPANLEDGYRLAAALLNPVLMGSAPTDSTWDPRLGTWVSPGR